MKKQILLLLLITILIGSVSFADEIRPTKEEIQKNIIQTIEKENKISQQYPNDDIETYALDKKLSIKRVEQMYNHYCGVAATKMILDHKGHYISQPALAEKLGTTDAGTSSYAIKNVLNSYTDFGYIVSAPKNYGDGTPVRTLANVVKTLDRNYGVTYSIKYSSIDSSKSGTGHFIVGIGYRKETTPPISRLGNIQSDARISGYYYLDSYSRASNKGTCYISSSGLYNAIVANEGYFVW